MIRTRCAHLLLGFVLLSLVSGCTDPAVKKQRLYRKGMEYFQAGKYPEAGIEFASAVQIDKDFVDARYQLAQCHLKQGAYGAAFNELMRVTQIRPTMWKAQIDLGNLMVAAQRFDMAKEKADAVLAADPNDIDGHILMANIQAGKGDSAAAFAAMRKAIELDPKRPMTYLEMAMIQARFQPEAAEATFQKAIELDPSRNAVMSLGDFYRDQKRWPEAEAAYRRAIDLPPIDQEPRVALAHLYAEMGDSAGAEQALLDAGKAAPNDPEVYRMFGDYLVSTGQRDRAVFQFAWLHRQHPDDLRVTKNYITLLIGWRRLVEATGLVDQILRSNKRDVEAQLFRAEIWTLQGRAQEAADLLLPLVRVETQNGRAHYLLGSALFAIGNLSMAESEWREAIRLRPDLIAAREALAALAARRGDTALLEATVDQLIANDTSNPRWYILRATAEMSSGKKDLANADLLKAISVAPNNPIGYASLGNLRLMQGKLQEAEKSYETALEKDPRFADALQGLMALYMQQNQPDKALARIDAQIQRAPDVSAYYTYRGTLLMTGNSLDGAIQAFSKAVDLNPNNVDAFALLGQCYVAKGSLNDAILNYEKAVKINPYDARSFVLLGSLEYSRGDFKRADEMYRKALGIEPDYPLAANNLAYLMLERGGNVDVAASLAQVARRGMPEEPTAADTLAWAYYKKGAYNLAIDLLTEALRASPNNPTYHYHIGMAYQGTHQRDQARDHLQKVLQLNPQDAHADEIQKALKTLERG